MVLVIDFGSQYSELLARKIRSQGVYAEIKGCDDNDLIAQARKYEALVISGSPCCAKDELHEETIRRLIDLKKPMLCVCYGMQVIHKMMGGELVYNGLSEFGETKVDLVKYHSLVDGLPMSFRIWMSHSDSVSELASGFISIARTPKCHSIAVNDAKKIYTIQFHPEIDHDRHGERIIGNFLFLICRIRENWRLDGMKEKKMEEIVERAGSRTVYMALSGGVDSSVVMMLIEGARVKAKYVHIKTGLFCTERLTKIEEWLKETLGEKLVIVNAEDRFLNALEGVTDPEEKRKKIGVLFAKIFREESEENAMLAQGTIKSDLVESGAKNKHRIKTHHNTVDELKKGFEILEPISDLFKDEVRAMAKELGVPKLILEEQPFPGVGYAIRIIGEVTRRKIEMVKEGDRILHEELKNRGLYEGISQCFCVLMECKSVGVVGDRKSYGHVMAIRAVDSTNIMAARVAKIPLEVLGEIGLAIINRIEGVCRVVYDVTSKPPATIEWE